MRKEILLAIFTGIILGLVVTYGVYRANKAITHKKIGYKEEKSVLPTPQAQADKDMELTIVSPTEGSVFGQSSVAIKGTSLPDSVIVIMTDSDEVIAETNEDGVFTKEIDLVKGANTLRIYATDFNKISAEKIIHLVYSTEINQEEK